MLEDENQPDTVSPIEDRNEEPVDSSGATVVTESPPSASVVVTSTVEGVVSIDSVTSPAGDASLVVTSVEAPEELNQPETVFPIEERNDGPVDSSGACVVTSAPSEASFAGVSRTLPVELSDTLSGEAVVESSVVPPVEDEENHPDTVLPMEEKKPGPVVSSRDETVVASSAPSLVVDSVVSEAPSGA